MIVEKIYVFLGTVTFLNTIFAWSKGAPFTLINVSDLKKVFGELKASFSALRRLPEEKKFSKILNFLSKISVF